MRNVIVQRHHFVAHLSTNQLVTNWTTALANPTLAGSNLKHMFSSTLSIHSPCCMNAGYVRLMCMAATAKPGSCGISSNWSSSGVCRVVNFPLRAPAIG